MSPTNEPGRRGQLELVSGSLTTSNSVEATGKTRRVVVAGQVPAGALRNPGEVPVVSRPDSNCATAFRLLARQIEHLRNLRRAVITSNGAGEGKSFCALNLGLALASAGTGGVLLVEANFERPVLAERIGFTPPGCFGEWLRTAAEVPGRPFRSVSVCHPDFHVLAVDPATTNTNGIVGVGFEVAIRQLCLARYRYIIVDGPQVTGSADASVIADSMDGVILCAAKGSTKLNDYRDAAKRLRPVPILAKVLLERPAAGKART